MAAPPDTRQHLINTATKLFSKKGFDGVSVREICAASKLNICLISYHFGGKKQLYRAVLGEHMLHFRSELEKALSGFQKESLTKAIFRSKVHAIISAVVQLRITNPDVAPMMLRERLSGMQVVGDLHEELAKPLAILLTELIEQAKKQKIVREDLNAKAYFLHLFESIWGFFILHDCNQKLLKDTFKMPRDQKEYVDFLTNLFTEGVLR